MTKSRNRFGLVLSRKILWRNCSNKNALRERYPASRHRNHLCRFFKSLELVMAFGKCSTSPSSVTAKGDMLERFAASRDHPDSSVTPLGCGVTTLYGSASDRPTGFPPGDRSARAPAGAGFRFRHRPDARPRRAGAGRALPRRRLPAAHARRSRERPVERRAGVPESGAAEHAGDRAEPVGRPPLRRIARRRDRFVRRERRAGRRGGAVHGSQRSRRRRVGRGLPRDGVPSRASARPGSPNETTFYAYYSSYCPTAFDAQANRYQVDFAELQSELPAGLDGRFLQHLVATLALPRGLGRHKRVSGAGTRRAKSRCFNIRLYNGSHRGGGLVFGNDGLSLRHDRRPVPLRHRAGHRQQLRGRFDAPRGRRRRDRATAPGPVPPAPSADPAPPDRDRQCGRESPVTRTASRTTTRGRRSVARASASTTRSGIATRTASRSIR